MALEKNYIFCVYLISFINTVLTDTTSVDYAEVPIVEKSLHTPPLEELVDVLSRGLSATFDSVNVTAEESPDFTQPPYNLTSPGLTGDAKLVDIGALIYLLPVLHTDKLYDLVSLVKYLGRDPAFLVGAAGGPWPYVGVNGEGIINLSVNNGTVEQGSRVARVEPIGAPKGNSSYVLLRLPETETRVATLGHFLLTEGKPGKVVKVVARGRTGTADFVTAIRETLEQYYGDNVVGIGGMFMMNEGIGKYHVMPQHGLTPVNTDEELDEWLHHFEMRAPITHVGTLITGDLDLEPFIEHFHGFSDHGDGGHYHYDITPEIVEYEGYFVPATSIIRVDQPDSHAAGLQSSLLVISLSIFMGLIHF